MVPREREYGRALGQRLRSIRMQQDLSLKAVEENSLGRWNAAVIGSYERADRAVTVAKLAELADFYDVPVDALLPEIRITRPASSSPPLAIDLARLAAVPAHLGGPLARYAAAIQSERGDYSGKVLTVRIEDLNSLAVIYEVTPETLVQRLVEWGVLPEHTTLAAEAPSDSVSSISGAHNEQGQPS